MSGETHVSNLILKYLTKQKFNIFQHVSPGTQAGASIYFKNKTKKTLIFPDILCSKKNTCLVGEAKPSFSLEDYKKLKKLAKTKAAQTSIFSLFKRYTKKEYKYIQFFMTYSAAKGGRPLPYVDQIIFSDLGVEIIPAKTLKKVLPSKYRSESSSVLTAFNTFPVKNNISRMKVRVSGIQKNTN
jgi:hypothetical protein